MRQLAGSGAGVEVHARVGDGGARQHGCDGVAHIVHCLGVVASLLEGRPVQLIASVGRPYQTQGALALGGLQEAGNVAAQALRVVQADERDVLPQLQAAGRW